MATTLKDIATAVGISQVSVSQALRGTGRISPEMRRRVIDVARKLRYRPNGPAKTMRSGRTGVVGVLYTIEGAKGMLPIEQLAGIQRELVADSYELLLCELPRDRLVEEGHASALLHQWMADGMLINHQLSLPDGIGELVFEQHVPAIWMNSRMPYNCVYVEDFEAAEEATRHLLSLGHRRVGYFDVVHALSDLSNPEHYSVADRAAGYASAMRAAGLHPNYLMPPQRVEHSQRLSFTRGLLSNRDTRPTALICYAGAELPIVAALTLGLNIPSDLSIVDFAGSLRPVFDIPLTSVLVQWESVGRASAKCLLSLMQKSESSQLPPMGIRPQLVVQASSVRPPE
jgi:DNA-binding LacI/PurR family transcriptional regulator